MEREIAIEVKNLYISYRNLQKFSIKQSLLHFKKVQADVFQAVKDVSFEVEKGENTMKKLISRRTRNHRKERKRKIHHAQSTGRHFFTGYGKH